jgi:hypothetical protein
VATGQLLSTLEGHAAPVIACAISPDGQRIVSASRDMTLKIWKTSTGECLDMVHGTSPFVSVAVSHQNLCAGDASGNLWHLYFTTSVPLEDGYSANRPIRLFISYSHEDDALRKNLETHLALLKREGLLDSWHDRRVAVGDERARQIDKHLNKAELILLLVSADFLASNDCYNDQMLRALDRHDTGQACVIPVILREADWHSAPFARLQALPKDARPVTLWRDRDEAWADVVKGIRRAVEALRGHTGYDGRIDALQGARDVRRDHDVSG